MRTPDDDERLVPAFARRSAHVREARARDALAISRVSEHVAQEAQQLAHALPRKRHFAGALDLAEAAG